MMNTWATIIAFLFGIVGQGFSAADCTGNKTSPFQGGFDLRVSPGIPVGQSGRTSVHPTFAYERSFADGGHDNGLHFGGQVRHKPSRFEGRLSGTWFGGEVSYVRRSSVVTDPTVRDPDDAGVTNGWRIGGLFGIPIYRGQHGSIHFSASGGIIKFGGAGPSFRVGLEFQPPLARR